MPNPKYTGSPSGEGNPPGKHSEGYLTADKDSGHFVADSAYKVYGDLGSTSSSAGKSSNQPQKSSTNAVGLHEGGIPYK